MRAPMDSSRDPLWWVMVVVGVAVTTFLVLLDPIVGVIWVALLLGFGVGRAIHEFGPAPPPVEPTPGTDDTHRLLVLANAAAAGRSLWTEIQDRCGEDGEVLIVAPALTDSRATLWASDLDQAIEAAGRRLEVSLVAAREAGVSATGRVGDADPGVAMQDALRAFPADEIVIWTHTPDRAPWLERGIVQRAREEVGLPITHVVIDTEARPAELGPQDA